MQGKKEVEIVIHPDGQTEITVKGSPGPACVDIADGFRKALGAEISKTTKTSEYYLQGGGGRYGGIQTGR